MSARRLILCFALSIIGLIARIANAFWPAPVAGCEGHSFIGYFILSFPFFFPLALMMAYAVRDRRPGLVYELHGLIAA